MIYLIENGAAAGTGGVEQAEAREGEVDAVREAVLDHQNDVRQVPREETADSEIQEHDQRSQPDRQSHQEALRQTRTDQELQNAQGAITVGLVINRIDHSLLDSKLLSTPNRSLLHTSCLLF